VRIDLCGVRGSTPAPGSSFERYGGHTSCVALTPDGADAPTLILDAGTGIRIATELLGGRPFAGAILLSHLHWDHIQGLPFFGGGDCAGSEVSVLVPDQQTGETALEVLTRPMSPPFFPVAPDALRGSWRFASIDSGHSAHGGFDVLAREIPHKGGRTFGLRVSDGRGSLTYMPDHCPTSLGPGPDGYGEYHEAALELTEGSDVIVHDAQLLASELGAEAAMGHSCAEYAVELTRRAGARSVQLFHHRPDRTDEELTELERAWAADPAVALARQGATILL
jgi:phosphoribosyl 1,2-cyclic phosphodiesterase